MKRMTIKEFHENDRPMEKLRQFGPEVLDDTELLAILIGSGTKKKNAIELASEIMNSRMTKRELLNASCDELMKIPGLGLSKSSRIIAGLRLGRRLSLEESFSKISFSNTKSVAEYFYEYFLYDDKEKFCTVLLDTKNKPIATIEISVGTLNASLVHPREVFKPAIKNSANKIILVHNHPSGDPRPSMEDIKVTKRLIEVGNIIGIEVLDHLIIGNNKYISLFEKNLIN